MASLLDASDPPSQATPFPQPPSTPNSPRIPKKRSTPDQEELSTGEGSNKKAKKSRAGVPNYNKEDIDALLDFTSEAESLGANHWAWVAQKFSRWAKANERPVRDGDSLKHKFDKLANTKKKTGDPSCPPHVRRAKHIARDILNKCAATSVSGDSSDGNQEANAGESDKAGTGGDSGKVVGERARKRDTGATGVAKAQQIEERYLEHVAEISACVQTISKAFESSESTNLTQSSVVSIVRHEVQESMRPTNALLSEMMSIIRSQSNK
ncbi:unnamed protein product [Chondrus crispus]|uniref:DUF6818 domain-containing protein n=1 Tax=Chondrus crispus TaxID=2769 RepID=R7Q5B2_CHOCR|nr:unnamed protein product [Chondrus crispus]CDF33018.1 unnamed protein product [Chondrus crispus]|eukprot:XP_005712821.1 unnamed protein product [Chondrus crispus]